MRVISMVPSWTETLIECDIEVVGRTRFCIHPQSLVKQIPIVGGTKVWNLEKVKTISADLIIFDKEENPKELFDQSPTATFCSHIQSVYDVAPALKELGVLLNNQKLLELSERYHNILSALQNRSGISIKDFPGVIEWGRKPKSEIKKVIYIIWKNPWMAVSRQTFIGSVFDLLGNGLRLEAYPSKYPEIDLQNEHDKESTLLLFSSEPFLFLKRREGLSELGFPYAFVDGESFSWFGVRSLRFLESLV